MTPESGPSVAAPRQRVLRRKKEVLVTMVASGRRGKDAAVAGVRIRCRKTGALTPFKTLVQKTRPGKSL
jgi:hypothetical protein